MLQGLEFPFAFMTDREFFDPRFLLEDAIVKPAAQATTKASTQTVVSVGC